MKFKISAYLFLLLASFSALAEEKLTFYFTDALGSPVAATDGEGRNLWKEDYAPYGVELEKEQTLNHRGYTGHVKDDDTGLVYMQSRYYDPVIGRFNSVDPVGFNENNLASLNRYAYANNNPYKYVDPNGESPIDVLFLAADVTKLGVALYSGVGVGAALADVGMSLVGVASPIPGTGQALKMTKLAKGIQKANETYGKVERGVIYKVPGKYTASGKPYIGRANDMGARIKSGKNDGRDRSKASPVGDYVIGDRVGERVAEQRAMLKESGGNLDNLDNKRWEIKESDWHKYKELNGICSGTAYVCAKSLY